MEKTIEEITTPYDHTKKLVHEACGLSLDILEDVRNISFELLKEHSLHSKLVEQIEQTFSRRELAFIASIYFTKISKEAEAMAAIFSYLEDKIH